MPDFSRPYNAKDHEERIYAKWLESGYFTPENLPNADTREPFTIIMPPPNVTGNLHIGHALTVTIEDIIVRYQRMLGKKTLWIPGTDHASIATETKFLKEKKISRNDYINKRDEFIELVNDFALKNQEVILKQLRAMGSSLDWSRLAFTLDEKRKQAVYMAFRRMYDAGLIYHGEYLVNWDTKGQTTVSDDEIEYETTQGKLYTFKYSKDFPIPIATTRPETKLGDVAVAVHPSGKWKKYIGEKIEIENFAGVKLSIAIIGDEMVDPEFGTGAVGITPAHSKIDGEIARRHHLPTKQVINEYGKIIKTGTDWDGKTGIKEVREEIVGWLKKEKLLEKEEIIEHNIAKAQRSGGVIEILPKRHQFFVNVNKPIPERDGKTLKDIMRAAVTSEKIKIIPERFEKIYFNWIDNLRDWNISRQVWYGHKIPAWYKEEEIIVSEKSPGNEWNEINDTFDTWFSSGLWTFSTLGWPNKTEDLQLYHPTDILETGYDIIFFWVARMILMTGFLLDDIPFKTIYLHGLVRDAKGRKMSKSLGNSIDPLIMIDTYGTDALRMGLIVGNPPGNDLALSDDKVKAYKHFANKIWNAARFVLANTEGLDLEKETRLEREDAKIQEQTKALVAEVTQDMEQFHLYLAAEKLYHYFWHTFADIIIEEAKPRLRSENAEEKISAQRMLYEALILQLKLLHPFMPFVTEAVWEQIPQKNKTLLMVELWPHS